jgi:hypothetical protein
MNGMIRLARNHVKSGATISVKEGRGFESHRTQLSFLFFINTGLIDYSDTIGYKRHYFQLTGVCEIT